MFRLLLRPSLQRGAAREKIVPPPVTGFATGGFLSIRRSTATTRIVYIRGASYTQSCESFAVVHQVTVQKSSKWAFAGRVALGTAAATLIAFSSKNKETEMADCSATNPAHKNKLARIATPIEDITKVYDIGEVLGEGGFGQVYRATRRSNGRVVALKRIPKEWTKSGEFQREINALWVLNDAAGGHPNICQMYDVFEDDDEYWLSMELIEGGEVFEHLISHGAYSEIVAATFLRQFAEALAFMHSAGVVQ